MKYLIGSFLITMLVCTCQPHVRTTSPSFNGLYKGHIENRPVYFTINHSRNNHIAGYWLLDGVRHNLSGTSDGYEVDFNDSCRLTFEKDTARAVVSMGKRRFTIEKVKNIEVEDGITYEGLFYGSYFDLNSPPTSLNFDPDGSVKLRFYHSSQGTDEKDIAIYYHGTWEFQHACVKIYWHPVPGYPTPATSYYPGYSPKKLFKYEIHGLISEDSIRYTTYP